VSTLVFGMGSAIVMTRRNTVAVLMGVELILNAAALNFVAFGRFLEARPSGSAMLGQTGTAATGQVVGLFIIVAAAAEAAIALAIVLNFFNRYQTINLDDGSELKQ
jgi:NADH-quinone oxidoreductase subunit K